MVRGQIQCQAWLPSSRKKKKKPAMRLIYVAAQEVTHFSYAVVDREGAPTARQDYYLF